MTPNSKAWRALLGNKVVIKYDDGYFINPEGTRTRALNPDTEQAIIDDLQFSVHGRRPKLPDYVWKAGVIVEYQGF